MESGIWIGHLDGYFFITMYWTVTSTQNGVDGIFFHIFNEFLVGTPKLLNCLYHLTAGVNIFQIFNTSVFSLY